MFFSYTLAYDTMSIKFDFASIWRSMDEYSEYFFQKNTITDHSSACCNTVTLLYFFLPLVPIGVAGGHSCLSAARWVAWRRDIPCNSVNQQKQGQIGTKI